MRSPKSRILQLKQEIAELEQKLVTSCNSKPDLPTDPAVQSLPTSSPEEGRKPTSRNSVPSRGEASHTEEPSKKLRILSVKKPIDLTKPREKSAGKSFVQGRHGEGNFSMQKKTVKEDFLISRSKLQEERLAIMEKEVQRVNKEKGDLEKEQIRISDEMVVNENLAFMCREDALSRYAKRSELVGFREELEFVLESLEIQFADELEFCGDEDNLQTPSTVRTKQTRANLASAQAAPNTVPPTSSLQSSQNLENSIENNKILISALEKKYSRVIHDIENLLTNSTNSKLNSEILNFERVLEEKTIEHDLDTLENVILDLNALERFDIDEEILRLQLTEVVQQETKLRLDFDFAEKEIQEKLKNSSTKREINQLENELSFIRNQYRNRFAAINHWKEEVESVISRTVSNIHVSVQDRTILDEFSAAFGKINGLSSRQQMKNLLDGYLAKVNIRDKMIQNNLNEIKKKFVEKTQISGLLSKANVEKNKLQNEKFKFSVENVPVQKTQRMSENLKNPVKDKFLAIRNKILIVTKMIENEEKCVEDICRNLVQISEFIKNLKKKQNDLKNSMNKLQANQMGLKFG